MQKIIKICSGLCLIVIIVCFSERSYAEEDRGVKMEVKEISGQVSYTDKDFISIVYREESDSSKEYEMVFYIDKDVMLHNFQGKDLKELNEQDTVDIEYVQIDKQGKTKRVAKRIRFVKKKMPSLDLKGLKE